MKLKLNWGISIVVFYVAFMTALFSFVVFSTTVHNDLVTDDYYGKQIAFQQHIDKVKRTLLLKRQLAIQQKNDYIALTFPDVFDSDSIVGRINFYRPDDSGKDFFIDIRPDTNLNQVVPTGSLQHGLWKVKIDWAAGDSLYYNEIQIMQR